jgi:formylglycine-generating enzyme required for sulfatase activity
VTQVSRLVFLSLEGRTPPELGLPPLATAYSTFTTIVQAFTPFMRSPGDATFFSDVRELPVDPPQTAHDGVRLFYLMGHAWKAGSNYMVAILDNGESKTLAGPELLERISAVIGGPTILVIDTCNAAALLSDVEAKGFTNLTCIAASDDSETATEFGLDRSTRFALTLRQILASDGARDEVEVLQLAAQLRDVLRRPSLVPTQTVEYWSSGRAIRLTRKALEGSGSRSRRTRTYVYLRALFLTAGILIATGSVATFLYYRNHIHVELVAGPIDSVVGPILIEIHQQRPDLNQDSVLETRVVLRNGVTRLRLPATDLLLVLKVTYADGRPREIRFPIFAASGLSFRKKLFELRLPSDDEIRAHPEMAYVPKIAWLEGPDRTPLINSEDFWIDLQPVTVEEYLPVARQLVRDGQLEPYLSVLLTAEARTRALDATNLKQTPELLGQLQDVFDVINAESRATHNPDPEARALPDPHVPCPRCPAEMTIDEARLFCKLQNKRLPTDLEWELATRGVDGRLYPWGDNFDALRANVVGLPEKDQNRGLVSVDTYPNGRSPFGLMDTIGNAGDWIDSRGGYERTFMGGTFRFNKEDSLAYSSMPDTGDPLPLLPVTCRCASLP